MRPVQTRKSGAWRRFKAADAGRKLWMVNELGILAALKVLALFLYLELHILSRGRRVRIGKLNEKGKISIMVSYIEPYLRQLQIDGVQDPWIVVINPGACPNEQLSRMYGRTVWLLDDRHRLLRGVFTGIYRILSRTGSSAVATLQAGDMAPYARAWRDGRTTLNFSDEEEKAGQTLLRKLGVPPDAPFICFGLREAAFYEQVMRGAVLSRGHQDPELEHELEESHYVRNPKLNDFIPMATECAGQDLSVLRMGQVIGNPLPSGLHPNIVDYATTSRTPFGDVYLLGNCKFVVSGGAGIWWVSAAFDRPAVVTDTYVLYWRPPRQEDLFIPAKLFRIADKRLLTFQEMMDAGDTYSFHSNCVRDGIELIHNTSEEIAAVVCEMNQRLDGAWQTSEEDEELQRRFDSLYQPHHTGYGLPCRIGADFLRQHASLL